MAGNWGWMRRPAWLPDWFSSPSPCGPWGVFSTQPCPRGFIAGHSLGRPDDPALQKWILMDALGLLVAEPRPGEVVERDYTAGTPSG